MHDAYPQKHPSGPLGLERTDHPVFRLPLGDAQVRWLQAHKHRLRFAIDPASSPYLGFDKKRLVFVHVPKNAGTSVRDAIFKDTFRLPHFSAEALRRFQPQAFDDYLVVAVLRNPATRLASAFDYLTRVAPRDVDRRFGAGLLDTFGDLDGFYTGCLDDAVWRKICHWPHFRSQSEYVTDMHGRVIVDLLLCVEKLGEAAPDLSAYLGEEVDLGQRKNRGKSSYDLPADHLIDRLYKDDLALWQWVYEGGLRWVSPRERFIQE